MCVRCNILGKSYHKFVAGIKNKEKNVSDLQEKMSDNHTLWFYIAWIYSASTLVVIFDYYKVLLTFHNKLFLGEGMQCFKINESTA